MKKWFIQSDWLGISAASLCLIHCLAFPIIMLLGGSVHHTHSEWQVYDFVFLFVGLVAVVFSSKSSDVIWIKGLMWFAFTSLALSIFFRHNFHWLEYVAYASSFGLICVHVYNMYLGKSCKIPIS